MFVQSFEPTVPTPAPVHPPAAVAAAASAFATPSFGGVALAYLPSDEVVLFCTLKATRIALIEGLKRLIGDVA